MKAKIVLLILVLSLAGTANKKCMVKAQAYPIIESVTGSTEAGNTDHVVDYPAVVDYGDLLIAVFGCDDNEATVTFPNEGTDWNTIYKEDAGAQGPTLAVAWREADGTEDGGTFTIITGTAEGSCTYVFRITGATDPDVQAPEVSTEGTGSSANPNSLSLSPTGGSKDYLWISAEANDDDDDTTGWPANMGDNNVFLQVVTATLGIATEESTTTTFDPDQFTIANAETWEAVTIAVHPAAAGNSAPTNDGAQITDLEDGDNIYAQKQDYTLTHNVSDGDGFADIDYMEIRIKQGAATRATFRYDEDTDTFTIQSGDAEFELNIGACSAVENGNDIDVTYKFAAEWDATEEADLEIEGYVIDDEPVADTDTLQTDYFDIVTNLIPSGFAIDDDRGDLSQSLTFTGIVYYADDPASGNPTTYYPPDAEFTSVDIHKADHMEIAADAGITNGAFSAVGNAEAGAGLETYHTYLDMSDADYTDADEAPTDTFITDRIIAYWEQLDDTRTNINSNIEFRIKAVLDYDESALEAGDTLSSTWGALAWDAGNEWWEIAHTEAAVGAYTITVNAGSETGFGITTFTENITETNAIYDQIVAYWEQVNDTRTDINADIEFRIEAVLDYDDTELSAGDTLSSTWGALAWDAGNEWWEIAHTEAAVGAYTITVNAGSETGFGITTFTENITETNAIYDQFSLQTLKANATTLALGELCWINFTAISDHDGHVLDGSAGDSATLKDADGNVYNGTWNVGLNVWEANRTEAGAVIRNLNTYDWMFESTFSQYVLSMNGLSLSLTWGAPPTGFTVNLRFIAENGDGLEDVEVTMANYTVTLFIETTNRTGSIPEQNIAENNITLTATLSGYEDYSHEYVVNESISWVIRLGTGEGMPELVLLIFAGLSLITFIGMIIAQSLVISVSAAVVSFICWGVTALYYLYLNPTFPGPAVLFMLFAAISLIYSVYAGLQLINPYRREELDDI